jgi:monoamine oxidase
LSAKIVSPPFRRCSLSAAPDLCRFASARWNGKAMLSTPFTDPNFLCSYSYWKPGQYTGFSGYEGVRQGNIHFAGEHCSTGFQGFMEGGASEGVRAANEILTDIGMLAPSPH